jgi:hypothetical protein
LEEVTNSDRQAKIFSKFRFERNLIVPDIKNLSRRTIALFWLLLTAIVIGIILYYELIEVLYILATLSLVTLLLIVSFADLENVGRDKAENISPND